MKVTMEKLNTMAKEYGTVEISDISDDEVIVLGVSLKKEIKGYDVKISVEEGWFNNYASIEIATNLGVISYKTSLYKDNEIIIPDFLWEVSEKIVNNYINLKSDEKKTKIIINGEIFKSLLEIMERRENGKLLYNDNKRILHKGEVVWVAEYTDPYGEEYYIMYFGTEEEVRKYKAYAYSSGEKMELCRLSKIEG